jgi:FkbM family methyltransferase
VLRSRVRISLYTLKRALLSPRTAYMRRRERKNLDQFERSMLELFYYSRAMSDMRRAMEEKPDLLVDAELDERSVVLDVGAYHGEWSETIATRYGATIYAFEPDPTSLPQAVARLAARRAVTVLDYGLGGTDRTAVLALAGPGSSIFASHAPLGTSSVRIRDAVAVLAELGLEHIDLLKVNIEGGEYDLLERLIGAGWLPRIRQVMVQFHEWHPKAYRRRRRIRSALRRTHREVWCYPWVWELWRRRAD